MADAPMVLPPGVTALTPVQFFARFAQLKGDLSHHLVRSLRLMPKTMESAEQAEAMAADVSRTLTDRVKALAEQGKVQFAVAANGEPGVFSSRRSMTEDEQELASALVSYFDTTGTFNERTGEVVDAESEMEQLGARLMEAADAAGLADLVTLTSTDYTALTVLCDAIKAPPVEVIGLLKRAFAEIPNTTPEIFVKGVLNGLLKHAEEKGEGVELVTAALENVHAIYSAHMVDDVLRLQQQIALDPLSGATKFEEQVALAFLTYWLAGSPAHPEFDTDPLWVLHRFKAWRPEHLEEDTDAFFDYLVAEDLRESLALAYRRFREHHLPVYRRVQEERDRQAKAKAEPEFPDASLDDFLTEEVPHLIAECASELTASKRIIREILDRWVGAGVIRFVRTPKGLAGIVPDDWPVFVNKTERGLCSIFKRRFHTMEVTRTAAGQFNVVDRPKEERPTGTLTKFLQPGVRSMPLPAQRDNYKGPGDLTYMRAVMAQYATLVHMEEEANRLSKAMHSPERFDIVGLDPSLMTGWIDDIRTLRAAETYCWFDEQLRAAEHAAVVCPESVRMTEELLDGRAGFWYFLTPRNVQTVSDPDVPIHGILWAWVREKGENRSALRVTALCPGPGDALAVSTTGYWLEGRTLGEAIQWGQTAYRTEYKNSTAELIGEEKSLAAVEYMLRFFFMGCLWMREKIPVLVRKPLRIEASKKKRRRLEEMAKRTQRPLTDVQVIQLRRRVAVRLDDPSVPEEERRRAYEYSCRWIVKGHVRNQWYPSLGRHKDKWIESYDKGPEGKPLKVPTHRVYVVNR